MASTKFAAKAQRDARKVAASLKAGDRITHRLHGGGIVVWKVSASQVVVKLDRFVDELGTDTFQTFAGNITPEVK